MGENNECKCELLQCSPAASPTGTSRVLHEEGSGKNINADCQTDWRRYKLANFLTVELREWYMKATEQFSWTKSELIAAIDDGVHESKILNSDTDFYPSLENEYVAATNMVKAFFYMNCLCRLRVLITLCAKQKTSRCRQALLHIGVSRSFADDDLNI